MEYSNSTMFKLATKCVRAMSVCRLLDVLSFAFNWSISIGIGSSEILNNIKKKKKSFEIM